MTHKQLTNSLTELKNHFNQRHQIGDFINRALFSGSVPSVFDFGEKIEELLIAAIEDSTHIPQGWIEAFVYEEGSKWEINSDEIYIETVEDFVQICEKLLSDFHINKDQEN